MPKRRSIVVVLLLLLVPLAVARAKPVDDAFAKLKKDAEAKMKDPAKEDLKSETNRKWDKDTQDRLAAAAQRLRDSKTALIVKLGDDDQLRSVEVLVEWALKAAKRLKKEIGPHLEEVQEDLEKFEKLLKAHVETQGQSWPPKTLDAKKLNPWNAKRYTRRRARLWFDAEHDTIYQLALAVGRTRDAEAINWLLKKGLKKLRKADGAEKVALAAVDAFTGADPALVRKTVLAEAKNAKEPAARVLVLEWLGKHKPSEAFDLAVKALAAPEPIVQRAAIACLRQLDDRRSVKPLIDLLLTARGTVAVEIEDVLHYYTGQSFQSSHAVWMEWWKKEGQAWQQGEDEEERFDPRARRRPKGGANFYGLETESERIVFVLDRSGSMSSAASADSRSTGQKPAGPGGKPTGPGAPAPGAKPEPEAVEGDTKIQVAKNQLVYSVKNLPPDVYFNIVFYSSDVKVWKDPPEMLEANEKNKKAAVEWVESITAEGSTQLFDALLKAVEYADNLDQKDPTKGGCDTIFLLSDGSPTTPAGGEPLQGDELEAAWQKVKHANRIFKCVMHTIGVGRGHNRTLMQRIASETGGTYKAVGTK